MADRSDRSARLDRDRLRENYRVQLIASIGGWSGALIAAIPTTVFVVVNVLTALRPAILAAVGSAALLTAYRLLRRQPVQQAVSGLLGVVVAAFIAARTGQARNYFVVGIVTSFVYAVPFLVSAIVRRPLVGLLWEFLDPTPGTAGARPDTDATGDEVTSADGASDDATTTADASPPWYRVRPLLRAYTWSTLVATAVFLARGSLQLVLFRHDATGWLAVTRIVMGYPMFVLAVGVAFLLVRRARTRVTPG